jgi:hypothetical protein
MFFNINYTIIYVIRKENGYKIIMSAFRDRGVPGPTSEDVAACPSPDGSARDRARRGEKGGRSERERGGNPAAFVFVPRPGRVRLQ